MNRRELFKGILGASVAAPVVARSIAAPVVADDFVYRGKDAVVIDSLPYRDKWHHSPGIEFSPEQLKVVWHFIGDEPKPPMLFHAGRGAGRTFVCQKLAEIYRDTGQKVVAIGKWWRVFENFPMLGIDFIPVEEGNTFAWDAKRGHRYDLVLVDDAHELGADDLLRATFLARDARMLFTSCYPANPFTRRWLTSHFAINSNEGWPVVRATSMSNPHLGEDYHRSLKNLPRADATWNA